VEEEPEPEPTFDGVELLLAFEERPGPRSASTAASCFEQTVEAGETRALRGRPRGRVRFGNAGGVRVQLNGEDLGAPGGRGQVVTVVYTPEGAEPA
jgi:cytoskeleton protein RodZ